MSTVSVPDCPLLSAQRESRPGQQVGDDLDLSPDDDRIVLAPARPHPRTGWADAAKRIADAADDGLVWPEFGNADDADLEW
jgi:antitoxin MazE